MRRSWWILAALAPAACVDPLVGGRCLDGYRPVDGACVENRDVDLDRDDGAGGDGGSRDGGSPANGATTTGTGDAGSSPTSSTTAGSGGGSCETGQTECGGACVDVGSDPFACGGCGIVCPSGICVDGRCEGALAGHVVLCGFEPAGVGGIAPSRIVANAIFAWPTDPVRVAILGAAGRSTKTFTDVVSAEAGARGREVSFDKVEDDGTMAARLDETSVDVAVVAELPRGAAEAAEAGETLQHGMAALAARGGVIVVLAPEFTGSLGPFLREAGIASDVAASAASAEPLDVVAFDDALAVGIPSVFARPEGTIAFVGSPGGRTVVTDRDGRAVVVHAVVPPAP